MFTSCILIFLFHCRFDTSKRRIVEGHYDDHSAGRVSSLPFLNGSNERKVNLTVTTPNQFLGFNIRGGGEYGLGIFVSKSVAMGAFFFFINIALEVIYFKSEYEIMFE